MSKHKFTIPASSEIQISGGGNTLVFSAFSASSGLSAYQIAVQHGFVGTEAQWLASLSGAVSVPFSWGDASPAAIATAIAGRAVYRVELTLTAAFDGMGASVTVGDAASQDRLFAADQIDLTTPGVYSSHPGHAYVTDTIVNLYITPGPGASAGAGFLLIYIQD